MIRSALTALALTASLFAAERAAAAEAIFAGGCFWCVEADFEKLKGVGDAVSGFTGGSTNSPEYGASGDHIEAVVIPFNDSTISYAQMVNLFLRSIDVTDAGGQFCDRGREYTTAIFVKNEEQRRIAEEQKALAEAQLGQKIVTPILDASRFYPVGDYHQDYYKQDKLVITRRGPKTKAEAYKFYREACGRDARVRQIWGSAAAFAS